MTGAPIIYVSLLCLASGARAQGSPDLFTLTFTPGPVAVEAVGAAAARDERVAPRETEPALSRLLDSVARLEQSIAAKEAAHGRRSRGLVDDLTSLAAAYREAGEHLPAIAILERARYISRSNDGLHSLEQAGIVDELADSVAAAGRQDESDKLQDALLELASRNAGEPRAPSLIAAVADRQMAAARAYLEHGAWLGSREPLRASEGSGWEPSTSKVGRDKAPPRLGEVRNDYEAAIERVLHNDDYEIGDPLELDTGLDETYVLIDTVNDFVEVGYLPRPRPPEWESEPPESDREWALAALRRARRLYSTAMQQAFSQENYAEYQALERQLLGTYYFEMENPELHPSSVRDRKPRRRSLEDVIYLTGASVLEAGVVDRLSRGAPPVEVARALVELGDWHLLFSFNRTALETYQDAHDLLVGEGAPAEAVTHLFAPEVPAILPAFATDALAFDPARQYRGHIDVSIETGRYGESKRVDIIGASPGTSSAIERRLQRHIARAKFRPRFVEGRLGRSDRFSLRYYFDYADMRADDGPEASE